MRTKQCEERGEERRGHATSEKTAYTYFLSFVRSAHFFFVSLFTALLLLVSAWFQVLPSSISVSVSSESERDHCCHCTYYSVKRREESNHAIIKYRNKNKWDWDTIISTTGLDVPWVSSLVVRSIPVSFTVCCSSIHGNGSSHQSVHVQLVELSESNANALTALLRQSKPGPWHRTKENPLSSKVARTLCTAEVSIIQCGQHNTANIQDRRKGKAMMPLLCCSAQGST